MQINILIIGDSRVLPRKWENKDSYFELKLKELLHEEYPDLNVCLKTIAEPNKLISSLVSSHKEIMEFYPDMVIFNLNLCDYIPRSLPKKLFDLLEKFGTKKPVFADKIRKFLAKNRRVLHKIFGKNSWNTSSGYINDLKSELAFLKNVTENILYLGCIDTSVDSEYLRPGFMADIRKFNIISKKIVNEKNFDYIELNDILTGVEYNSVSNDGIHYTDEGDNLTVKHIFNKWISSKIEKIMNGELSCNFAPKPYYIQVELTNLCSVRCTMCELNNSTRPKGYMNDDTYLKIIDQLVHWGIPTVRFTLWGEALMHPKIIEYIDIAKKRNLITGLNTNGILLDEQLTIKLLNSGLDQIIFSVDSFDDNNIYRKFRPSNKSIHDINNTILYFIKKRDSLGIKTPQVFIQMIGSELNASQHKPFIEYWTPLTDSCRITHLYSMKQLTDVNLEITEEQDYFYECKYPWNTMGIYYNGDVTACCRDVDGRLYLGNIHEEKLEKIFECGQLREMRKSLMKKEKNKMPDFCKNCYKYVLK